MQTILFSKSGIAALLLFFCGAFLGFFLTAMTPMSVESWRGWVGARVFFQLGSALLYGIVISYLLSKSLNKLEWRPFILMVIIGVLLSFNALRALVSGPLVIEGDLMTSVTKAKTGTKFTSTENTSSRIEIRGGNGEIWRIDPIGYQSNRWQKFTAECETVNSRVQLTTLYQLDAVLGAKCLK